MRHGNAAVCHHAAITLWPGQLISSVVESELTCFATPPEFVCACNIPGVEVMDSGFHIKPPD
jgi:hypothetical protein